MHSIEPLFPDVDSIRRALSVQWMINYLDQHGELAEWAELWEQVASMVDWDEALIIDMLRELDPSRGVLHHPDGATEVLTHTYSDWPLRQWTRARIAVPGLDRRIKTIAAGASGTRLIDGRGVRLVVFSGAVINPSLPSLEDHRRIRSVISIIKAFTGHEVPLDDIVDKPVGSIKVRRAASGDDWHEPMLIISE